MPSNISEPIIVHGRYILDSMCLVEIVEPARDMLLL